VCYVAPKSIFDEYAQDLRTRGESPPLDLADLRRETAKEPYWVPAPTKEPRSHRASLNGSQQSCWVISLTKSEKGYIFPFGEDLEQILEPNQPERDTGADAARDRVQDEKG